MKSIKYTLKKAPKSVGFKFFDFSNIRIRDFKTSREYRKLLRDENIRFPRPFWSYVFRNKRTKEFRLSSKNTELKEIFDDPETIKRLDTVSHNDTLFHYKKYKPTSLSNLKAVAKDYYIDNYRTSRMRKYKKFKRKLKNQKINKLRKARRIKKCLQ